MKWPTPNSSPNRLQQQIQELLDKDADDDNSNNFRLDVDKQVIRQIIGLSFAEEPGFKWGMEGFDRNQVLKTQEELVHFSRFVHSVPLLEDLEAPLHFQLCQVESSEEGDEVVVSCASLHACESTKPSGPMWLRRIRNAWKMTIQIIKILYGFGDSFPSAVRSSYMSQLEAKMQPFIDHVDDWHFEYGPSGEHWYLHLIGVNPAYNGRGKGTIMMNKICNLADELGKDIYLEACGKKLNGYYERFGFEVRGVETLADPEDNSNTLDVHLMVRCAPQR